jgi:hypothetical protein
MSINICQKIDCPYFNSNSSSFGCQRYAVAPHCHLNKEYQFSTTQYALYVSDEYDNLDDVKDSNDSFFLYDAKYQNDINFVRLNSDWITGWKVGELSERK